MKLYEFLADFKGADPEEALEILMEFGDKLPALSDGRVVEGTPPQCRIRECQTPVYLWVDVVDGRMRLEAVVAEESPTVRGFVGLLVEGLSGASPADVAKLPEDFLPLLGLSATLGMTRQKGFRGIVTRIKREAAQGNAKNPG
ncbi:MAG: SufE family protein [Deltaproteobacteria bacterium]